MNVIRCTFTVLFACVFYQLHAQYLPVHSNFYMNPYVYNTAFAGSEGSPAVFLSYRKQWVGIEGAPAVSNFTFHTPLKSKNFVTGLSLTNETNGLLSTNTAHVTLGYKLNFADNHHLTFAVSPSFILNNINYDGIANTADPALQKLMGSRSQFQSGMGFNYTYRKFNIGAFLPEMLKNTLLLTEVPEGGIDGMTAFQSYIFNISYGFDIVPGTFEFAPYLMYGKHTTAPEIIEAMGIFKVKNTLYFGASYRVDYGFTGLTGINLADGVSFGYAMEVASAQRNSQFHSGTHEVQLKIRFGSNKLESDVQRGRKIDERRARLHLESPEEKLKNEHIMHQGHYLITNSFYFYEDAELNMKEMAKRGLKPTLGWNERDDKFYVYLFASVTEKNVKKMRRKYIRQKKIRSGRIIRIYE